MFTVTENRSSNNHTKIEHVGLTLKQNNPLRRGFEIVGLSLSVIGLLFAFEQFFDFRAHQRTLRDINLSVSTALQKVSFAADAATTRSIGDFPASLGQITEVVRNSCESLDIMARAAGYGQYSAMDSFEEYLHAILAVRASRLEVTRRSTACVDVSSSDMVGTNYVRVRLLVYSPDLLEKALENQFRQVDFPSIATSNRFLAYFEHHKVDFPRPRSYNQFIQSLNEENLNYAGALAHEGVDVRFAASQYMCYIWMHDDQEAAFSFDYQGDTKGQVEREIAFRTRDAKLTSAFRDIFNLEWSKGTPFNVLK